VLDREPERLALARLEAELAEDLSPASDVVAASVSGLPDLNKSDADNLAFLLSHRLAHDLDLSLMQPQDEDSVVDAERMAELAERVARRLEELSMRLWSGERADAYRTIEGKTTSRDVV
jgi:hypothetical protein